MPNIKVLNISENPIENKGAYYLGRNLNLLKNLEILNINQCHITENGMIYICDGIGSNPNLVNVDISCINYFIK